MTASDVITACRRRLNDEDDSAYRYSDAALLDALAMAEAELFAYRPDYCLSDDDDVFSIAAPVTPTRLADPLSSADRFRECLMHGTLATIYSDDSDEHEANPEGKAVFHRTRFEQLKVTA